MVDWSKLPAELLDLTAVKLFSDVELKCFRSICSSWRSSVSGAGNNKPFPIRPLIPLNPFPIRPFIKRNKHINGPQHGGFPSRPVFLSCTAFFRVTLSSSSSKGWLIKTDVDIYSGKFCLLEPLSRLPIRHSCKSLDLLEFTFSDIQEAYAVQDWHTRRIVSRFKRVVLVKVKEGGEHHNRVLGVAWDGEIEYWKGKSWRSLNQMDLETFYTWIYDQFSDVIVHKGLTYTLDSEGSVWWISSDLNVLRYGPSLDENVTNGWCGDKSLVECCGELYIVDRLFQENTRKRKANCLYANTNIGNAKTVGSKVYKMDEELGKMVEVKFLGDNAFVMATDTCFSVLAHEFYGCLQNSIYFTDNEEKENKVFKLDNGNGSIMTMSESQSSFQMFVPSFL